jgi:NagD protein
MMRMVRKELELRTEEVTMIGNTMETDILGGLQMGYRTRLVCSGSTQPQDLTDFPYAPSLKGLIADL